MVSQDVNIFNKKYDRFSQNFNRLQGSLNYELEKRDFWGNKYYVRGFDLSILPTESTNGITDTDIPWIRI
jgi:hypothetical protein